MIDQLDAVIDRMSLETWLEDDLRRQYFQDGYEGLSGWSKGKANTADSPTNRWHNFNRFDIIFDFALDSLSQLDIS